MSDWSSTFWGSTAGLFGEEDEDDAFDPDRQVCIVFLHVPNRFRFFVLQLASPALSIERSKLKSNPIDQV